MSSAEWVEVAHGPDLATARRDFALFLELRGLSEEQLNPEDIRIDTIRGEFEDSRRIMVRKATAIRLGF